MTRVTDSSIYLATRLKALRVANKIDQKQMAPLLDITQSYLCLIEGNKVTPSKKILKKYSAYFGVPMDELDKAPSLLDEVKVVVDKATLDEVIHVFEIILHQRLTEKQ